ncbi:hypothetical protein L0P92_16195 [Streptomyces muensis]|uniref:HTH araC/xylS-type domain-containing protein n=1 Tax=Streptomyces muensis TaxID=1077944 RepID=A0A9X1PY09_STRM4|nr:hypothetical protein [Streptomyces muensis]MCF1595103.1 hypothetical protein [Streptomyces muensis]
MRIPGNRGIGALSSQFLLQLAQRMHETGPSDTARLSTLTLDVLTTALADALDAGSEVPPHTRRRALMAQIHAFVRENLGDPALTPDGIAAAHHISLRYLHQLFQQEERTVAGWSANAAWNSADATSQIPTWPPARSTRSPPNGGSPAPRIPARPSAVPTVSPRANSAWLCTRKRESFRRDFGRHSPAPSPDQCR